MTHDCPLCGLDFEGAACHSTCPLAHGCRLVRCPRCHYEFAGEGLLVTLLRRVLPKGMLHDSSAH